MAHSKRNTSLPHFTSYERGLLRNHWGTKRGVIGRDSFLPFASCRLCLQPARSPVVACATNGDLFCRECAISDLLAQRNDIKRVERERDDAKKRLAEDDERTREEAREREVREFELVSMGLEGNGDQNKKKRKVGEGVEKEQGLDRDREVVVGGKRKKVFELDEKEMARVVGEEQERLKEELKKEKVCIPVSLLPSIEGFVFNWQQSESTKSALPSFWVPSLTPGTDPNEIAANKAVKLTPICPASTETNRHSYSLKALVEVHFTEEKASDGSVARVCPSCKKDLSNGLKAMCMSILSSRDCVPCFTGSGGLLTPDKVTKPCGHIICQPCVTKFMTPQSTDVPDPHASKEEQEQIAALHGRILCYVCETDVTPRDREEIEGAVDADHENGKKKKKMSKKKEKENGIRPGLVEVCSEGTGFAGRGGNVATKTGVAFQC